MKAVVQDRYGSPDELELREMEKPVAGGGEVLVRVRAASVHPDVWHVVRGLPFIVRVMGAGLRTPKNRVPGTDVAGIVESAGQEVTRFRPGDEVFGECVKGHGWHNGGAYAEYVSVAQDALELKPAKLTFEEAAAVPSSALIALRGLRDEGGVRSGQRVLINGAGGGVGIFALQLAKAYGAEVTGVDRTEKLDMIRSLGADHVVDYTHEDFTRSGGRYDLIFDIPGNHSPRECRRALTPKGTYAFIGHEGFSVTRGRLLGRSLIRFLKLLVMSPFVSQRMSPRNSKVTKHPLAVLKEFIEAGKITPVIDRTYTLGEVPEAIRYLEEGGAKGKIVITI
jgi:NADPH:quinone reductase-like Zn-dependent oxidoreductase